MNTPHKDLEILWIGGYDCVYEYLEKKYDILILGKKTTTHVAYMMQKIKGEMIKINETVFDYPRMCYKLETLLAIWTDNGTFDATDVWVLASVVEALNLIRREYLGIRAQIICNVEPNFNPSAGLNYIMTYGEKGIK